jgi:hypothetical protein
MALSTTTIDHESVEKQIAPGGGRARRAFPALALGAICLLSMGLMLDAATRESAIADERSHIPAGYGYLHGLDYDLNPEHPPLVKVLAAAPMLFMNVNAPGESGDSYRWPNAQWDYGTRFLYYSGNNADLIIRMARIFPILLTLGLVLFVYYWASQMMGRRWALLPAFLVAFSPTFLAHGHYVTTDVGAALGFVVATYFFLKLLVEPTRPRIIIAGLAFGFAQLMKFSAVLLGPYFLILTALWLVIGYRSRIQAEAGTFRKNLIRYTASAAAVVAIGYAALVYPVYFALTWNYPQEKQVSDTRQILDDIIATTASGKPFGISRVAADINVWLANNPATRPLAHYMLGVMMASWTAGISKPTYFFGEVVPGGLPLYFPALFLLKEPLPVLAMAMLAVGHALARARGRRKKTGNNATGGDAASFLVLSPIAMAIFVTLYWAMSIASPYNIGYRHVLPTLPFIYILISLAWKGWSRNGSGAILKRLALAAAILLIAAESIVVAPYFLSYFNPMGGGVWGGYRYVTDSNYDWGQDLLRLKQWADAHPEARKIAVDYFGGGDVRYYLGDRAEVWPVDYGNPATRGVEWLAVSVFYLQGNSGYAWLGEGVPETAGPGEIAPPYERIGTSIFLYKLSPGP